MNAFAAHPVVMAGLVPAIHELFLTTVFAWMPGTSPGMTEEGDYRSRLRTRKVGFGSSHERALADARLPAR